MFTGVGGFDIGIERATNNDKFNSSSQNSNERIKSNTNSSNGGWRGTYTYDCIGFSENNKYASELLTQKFPTVKNYGDATKINPRELPDFDFLCGGFPCQAFSIAGKRRGFKDTRGTMFFEITRILKIKRPKIILLENVKYLLNHEKGKTFSIILEALDELGYKTQWMVLNSKFFGVPQNRERVFIIGSLRTGSRSEILPFGQDGYNFAEQDLEKAYNSGTITARYWKMGQSDQYISYARKDRTQYSRVYNTDGIAPTLAKASKLSGDCTPKIVASRGRNPMNPNDRTTGSPTEQRLEVNSERICNTLTSVQKDHMVMDGISIRRLTPTECERLQGFPDGWTEGFSDTQRYKMMGNAVTVNVIEAIMRKFRCVFPKLSEGKKGK